MALIKGSKVNQAGVVVVQGEQVIQEEAKAPTGRARERKGTGSLKADPVIVGGNAPIAPSPVEDTSPEPTAPAAAEEAEGPEPAWQREEAVPAADPPPPGDGGDPVEAWDTARDQVLRAAGSLAELAAENAAAEGECAADLYDQLFGEASGRITGALGDGPEGENALDAIVPALERQAAAQAELAAARAAARARWREMATAEEQIAALLSQFDVPESASSRILGEREQLLAEARLKAAQILTDAQEEAARIRADAEQQGAQALEDFELTRLERFEQLREEARAAGYTEGRAQADEEGAKIIEEAIETLNRARLSYPRAVKENQEKLIELALQVAEKIIGAEIEARPDVVLETLDVALTRVTDLESVQIRVHPDDLPIVKEKEDEYRDLLAQVKKLEFVPSPKIQRGGVFIETSSGTVDATLKTQLSIIAEVLRGVRKELDEIADAENEAFEELG
ncbi:MAG: hypothetical protein FJZ01_00275 [Candidatus Sericytochromatia bacterium]|nr:hypothetical protein [Candidatus Tanganyikabacteria bacterium]